VNKVLFVRKSRFAEMHLIINETGQKVLTPGIDDFIALIGRNFRSDALDSAVANEDISLFDSPFVDDPCILYRQ
jgi:hypothetical protein